MDNIKFIPDPEGYHDTIKTSCDKEGNFELAVFLQGNIMLSLL